ncbi:hypothetical protein [Flavobacterium sp.]|uniref:hypothetical protein n=1 Tax=Flavobacterium sp. TaxID=239 RepID=UPI0026307051|nr:hypothetical protein [Flavobacterium sp.]
MKEELPIWVIYDSPIDLPDRFVARKWLQNIPTSELLQAKTLESLREKLPLGLVRLPRDAQDDPKIVESWI